MKTPPVLPPGSAESPGSLLELAGWPSPRQLFLQGGECSAPVTKPRLARLRLRHEALSTYMSEAPSIRSPMKSRKSKDNPRYLGHNFRCNLLPQRPFNLLARMGKDSVRLSRQIFVRPMKPLATACWLMRETRFHSPSSPPGARSFCALAREQFRTSGAHFFAPWRRL